MGKAILSRSLQGSTLLLGQPDHVAVAYTETKGESRGPSHLVGLVLLKEEQDSKPKDSRSRHKSRLSRSKQRSSENNRYHRSRSPRSRSPRSRYHRSRSFRSRSHIPRPLTSKSPRSDRYRHASPRQVRYSRSRSVSKSNNNNNNRLYFERVTHLVTKLIFHEAL